MKKGSKLAAIASAALLVGAFAPGSAFGQQNKDEQKCINTLLKDISKVAASQGKENSACLKAQDITLGCTTADPKGKVAKKKQKTLDDVNVKGKCADTPSIGFTDPPNDAIDGNQFAMDKIILLLDEVFDSATPDPGKQESKCQQKVYKRVQKLLDTKWKTYNKCVKDALKAGGGASLFDDCLTGGSGVAGDPKGKQAKGIAKIGDDIAKQCPGGIATSLFPGACSGLDGPALRDCLDARVECIMCWIADDLVGTSVDCDLFDDGLSNGSCSHGTSHKCTFGPGSAITINTEAFPVPAINTSGAIDIDCGDGTLDINGKAPCTCEIQYFDPVVIIGIGSVCISGQGSCPAGEIDCDGGNNLELDTVSDHNIGPCASNAACSTACDAYCPTLGVGYTKSESGCENFCEGGANDGLACTQDTACPGGACNGPDGGSHGNVCGCQCTAIVGPASDPGDMQCQLPTKIFVVLPAGSPCTDPPTIDLPPVCIPLSTESGAGTVINSNNGTGTFGNSGTGTPFTCPDIFDSVTTGGEFVGVVNFFDSTLGDLSVLNRAVCQ